MPKVQDLVMGLIPEDYPPMRLDRLAPAAGYTDGAHDDNLPSLHELLADVQVPLLADMLVEAPDTVALDATQGDEALEATMTNDIHTMEVEAYANFYAVPSEPLLEIDAYQV